MAQQTVVIWDSCGVEAIRFFVVDADITHLNDVYINSTDSSYEAQEELNKRLFDDEGRELPYLRDFPVEAVKNGASVIVAGFMS